MKYDITNYTFKSGKTCRTYKTRGTQICYRCFGSFNRLYLPIYFLLFRKVRRSNVWFSVIHLQSKINLSPWLGEVFHLLWFQVPTTQVFCRLTLNWRQSRQKFTVATGRKKNLIMCLGHPWFYGLFLSLNFLFSEIKHNFIWSTPCQPHPKASKRKNVKHLCMSFFSFFFAQTIGRAEKVSITVVSAVINTREATDSKRKQIIAYCKK